MSIEIINNELISVSVDTEKGMTISSFSYKDKELLYIDPIREKEGKTYGIPVLFPTPNKTKNKVYSFGEKTIPAINHGFLRHETFIVLKKTTTSIKAFFMFDGLNPLFPYKGRYNVLIKIEDNSLIYEAVIKNLDSSQFGYGIALHPFFAKKNAISITLNNKYRMITDDNKFPTGKVVKCYGAKDDFSEGISISKIDENTVYIVEKAMKAKIEYGDFLLSINCSKAFNHAVVYTSPDKPFVCIEPQSCSSDVFNMASRRFNKEAHLLVLDPGKSARHRIIFSFSEKSNTRSHLHNN